MKKFNFNINIDIEDTTDRLGKSTFSQKSQKDLYEDLALCVDFNLPSGTLWAKYNTYTNPDNRYYGDKYAWGELEPKQNYNWENYKWCDKSYQHLTKYSCDPRKHGYAKEFDSIYDEKDTLELKDDAAYQQMNSFRIPTEAQFIELTNHVSSRFTFNRYDEDYLGSYGMLFEGEDDKKLFLPCDETTDRHVGFYWTSNCDYGKSYCAHSIRFGPDFKGIGLGDRCEGYLVRGVKMKKGDFR